MSVKISGLVEWLRPTGGHKRIVSDDEYYDLDYSTTYLNENEPFYHAKISDDIMENGVPTITPLAHYDPTKARLKASLEWLFVQAYGDEIPKELQNPIVVSSNYSSKSGIVLRAGVLDQLTSGELYCRICAQKMPTLPQSNWTGHTAVIEYLAQNGFHLFEDRDIPVTERSLEDSSPFRHSAHLALIDALMTLTTKELLPLDTVIRAISSHINVDSNETPRDVEAALLLWLNKICDVVRSSMQANSKLCIPVMEDLLTDISDGCCLAVVLSFYCPEQLAVEDIILKPNIGITDSCFNLQLVKSFCDRYLRRIFHLSVEDWIYMHSTVRHNVLVFLAELFHCFEVSRDIYDKLRSPAVDNARHKPAIESTHISDHARIMPLLSDATKRSLLDSGVSSSEPDIHRLEDGSLNRRQPLLGRRASATNRIASSASNTPTHHNPPLHSAWSDERLDASPKKSGSNSHLLKNVLLESDDLRLSVNDQEVNQADLEEVESNTYDVRRPYGSRNIRSAPQQRERIYPVEARVPKETLSARQPKRIESGEVEDWKSTEREPAPVVRNASTTSSSSGSNWSFSQKKPAYFNQPPSAYGLRRTEPPAVSASSNSQNMPGGISDSSQPRSILKSSYVVQDGDLPRSARDAASAGIPVIGDDAEELTEYFDAYVDEDTGSSSYRTGRESNKLYDDEQSRENENHEFEDVNEDDSDEPEYANHIELAYTKSTDLHELASSDDTLVSSFGDAKNAPRTLKKTLNMFDRSHEIVLGMTTAPPQPHSMSDATSSSSDVQKSKSLREQFITNKATRTAGAGKDRNSPHRRTTFGPLPNQTTWKESAQQKQDSDLHVTNEPTDSSPITPNTRMAQLQPLTTELYKVKLELEEKRRLIAAAKRRLDNEATLGRQKRGEATFKEVLHRKKSSDSTSSDRKDSGTWMTNSDIMERSTASDSAIQTAGQGGPLRTETFAIHKDNKTEPSLPHMSMSSEQKITEREVEEAIRSAREKLAEVEKLHELKSASLEKKSKGRHSSPRSDSSSPSANEMEDFHSSVDKLNQSLSDLQSEIMRLSLQQVTADIDKVAKIPFERYSLREQMLSMAINDGSKDNQTEKISSKSNDQVAATEPLEASYQSQPPIHQPSPSQPPSQSPSHQPPSQPSSLHYPSVGTPDSFHKQPHHQQQQQHVHQQQQQHQQQPPQPPYVHIPQPMGHMGFPTQAPVPPTHPSYHPGAVYMPPYGHPAPQVIYPAPAINPYAQFQQPSVISQPYLSSSQQGGVVYTGAQPASNLLASLPPVATTIPSVVPVMSSVVTSSISTMSPNLASNLSNMSPSTVQHTTSHRPETVGVRRSVSAAAAAPSHRHSYPYDDNNSSGLSPSHSPTAIATRYSPDSRSTRIDESPEPNIVTTPTGGGSGFFIALDENTPQPRRHKPKLSSTLKRQQNGGDRTDNSMSPQLRKDASDRVLPVYNKVELETHRQSPSSVEIGPSVALTPRQKSEMLTVEMTTEGFPQSTTFVIGEEQPIDALQQMEQKKRERLMNIEMKRRKEMERKQVAISAKSARLNELNRVQQEESERRKTEQKARQKKLFEEYRQKKAEQQAKEEGRDLPNVSPKSNAKKRTPSKPVLPGSGTSASSQNSSAKPLSTSSHEQQLHSAQPTAQLMQMSLPPEWQASGIQQPGFSNGISLKADVDGSRTHRVENEPKPPISGVSRMAGLGGVSSEPTSDSNSSLPTESRTQYRTKTNRSLMQNALCHCCLAGDVNKKVKNEVLQELERCDAKHFMILFRDAGCKYKGLYRLTDAEDLSKVHGIGPKTINNKSVDKLFKYNCGAKSFSQLTSAKHISCQIDAVTIKPHLWPSKKPTSSAKRV